MEILAILWVMCAIITIIQIKIKIDGRKKYQKKSEQCEDYEEIKKDNSLSQYNRKYRKKYLLSQNEKRQYDKIKIVTDSLGLVLFTKVRLADIIEPVAGIANWKTYWNKIQSKHVDFLICTANLNTLCALEIDDSSHKRSDRIERDNFVDFILNNVFIVILRKSYINEIELKAELEKMLEGVKV